MRRKRSTNCVAAANAKSRQACRELVMRELKQLDQVAYVRFASVYRSFEDVQAFREEIERLERDLPSLEGMQLPLLGDVVVRKGRG